jgi:hypothetical protein
MIFSDYITFTPTTNCYTVPDNFSHEDILTDVLITGLAEELTEFFLAETDVEMRQEAGDCLWYCSELLNAIGKMGITSFVQYYESIVDKHGIIVSTHHVTKALLSVKKKYIRGDFSIEEKRARVWELVSLVFKSFGVMYDMSYIMSENKEKLTKRIAENTIKGDNRENKSWG